MPFRLDLLRHGDARPAGSDGDAARTLSAIGRRDVTRVAEEYVRRGWRPDRILASPLRRAQETARILLLHLGEGADFGTVAELDPGCQLPVDRVMRTLRILTHEVMPALA